MARKRMIDPSIWADEGFGALSSDAKVMFIGLFSNADDEGRLPGDPKYLASTIFPYRTITATQARKILDEIKERMKSIKFYIVKSQPLIQFDKFRVYQKINRPTPSKYPPPPNYDQDYGTLTEDSMMAHGESTPNGIERNRSKAPGTNTESGLDSYKKTQRVEFENKAWEVAVALTNNRSGGGGQ